MKRIVSPSEYSFAVWMNGHPFSGHPLDDKRFFRFVKTIIRYKNYKYRDYQYFCEQVNKYLSNIDENKRDEKYYLMIKLIEFHNQKAISTTDINGDNNSYFAKVVGTDIIYEEISRK